MSEYLALEKHRCPACGAQAEWNATKQILVCAFCGTESAAELATGADGIVEHNLATALHQLRHDQSGWAAQRKAVQCRSCRAVTVFEPGKAGTNCDFCGSPELLDYEEIDAPIRPESLLPFAVDEERVRDIVRDWLGSHWLAPNKLQRSGLIDTLHGVYIPYWTFDSAVDCRWTAESGDYYYVTRTVRDANGRTRTVRDRRVRWYPSSGRIQHAFDDHLIPGSLGVRPDFLRAIEPFPVGDLRPYDTGYLSGWDIEHYQVALPDAARQAHQEKTRILERLAARQVPGDTHRFLKVHPRFSRETFKHILVPVWILAYDYGRTRHQVVINGTTGRIAGSWPKSPWKIALLILAGLILLGVIIAIGSSA